jgi:hypothetical protein
MPKCTLCPKPAVKRLTWVNDSGSGIGGGLQGGPMCLDCMSFINDALSRFPVARDAITIWPLEAQAEVE